MSAPEDLLEALMHAYIGQRQENRKLREELSVTNNEAHDTIAELSAKLNQSQGNLNEANEKHRKDMRQLNAEIQELKKEYDISRALALGEIEDLKRAMREDYEPILDSEITDREAYKAAYFKKFGWDAPDAIVPSEIPGGTAWNPRKLTEDEVEAAKAYLSKHYGWDRGETDKGGRPRKLTPEQEDVVRAEYAAGRAVPQIMERYSISRATVYRIIGRPDPTFTPEPNMSDIGPENDKMIKQANAKASAKTPTPDSESASQPPKEV